MLIRNSPLHTAVLIALAASSLLASTRTASAQVELKKEYVGEQNKKTSPWHMYKYDHDGSFPPASWRVYLETRSKAADRKRAGEKLPAWADDKVPIGDLYECVHKDEITGTESNIETPYKCAVTYLSDKDRQKYELRGYERKLVGERVDGLLVWAHPTIPNAMRPPDLDFTAPYDLVQVQKYLLRKPCHRKHLLQMFIRSIVPDSAFGIQGLKGLQTPENKGDIHFWGSPPTEGKSIYSARPLVGVPAIWVMSPEKRLYVSAIHSPGNFNHSSFLEGGSILAGGDIIIKDGKITHISNRSGHYRPPLAALVQALSVLKEWGVLANNVEVWGFKGDRYELIDKKEWDALSKDASEETFARWRKAFAAVRLRVSPEVDAALAVTENTLATIIFKNRHKLQIAESAFTGPGDPTEMEVEAEADADASAEGSTCDGDTDEEQGESDSDD
jgi:hypothetical protein